MVGDPPLNDLYGMLLRFHLHYYALSTDIEKAFLHVNLNEQDCDFTSFLWLSNPKDSESTFTAYRFKVVLFGSSSSPFMLSATVDNIISGFQTEEEIQHFNV